MRKRQFAIRDDETIFDMMRIFQNTKAMFDPLHAQMSKSFDFTVAELMWDPEIKRMLQADRRPAYSYNLLRRIFNSVIGVELQNRKKIEAKAKSGGDNQLAQIVTEVLWHYLGLGKFDYHRTKVFVDSIIAKYGVWQYGWDYTEGGTGKLFLNSVDPREIIFEPNYADPSWGKASYIFRKHSLSLEEILNTFALNDMEMQNEILNEARVFFEGDYERRKKYVGRKLKALFSAVYETVTNYSQTGGDNTYKNILNWWDPYTGKFDVLELHEKRTERIMLIPDQSGNRLLDITQQTAEPDGFNFSPEKIEQTKQMYGLTGEPRVDLKNLRYLTAVVPAFNVKVNDQPYPVETGYYQYIPQYCYDYHADPLKAQSMMDDLMDPQSHFNKAQSLKLELLGRYANKGWVMDENAIIGLEGDWDGNKIAQYKRVRAGYINQIRPEEGQTISPDLVRDPLETQQLMKNISNADDEISGQRSTEVKSGRHFVAKEQQQSRSFSYIFNNASMASEAIADACLKVIQHYVQVPTLVRITQDVDQPADVMINQPVWAMDENTGRIIQKIKNDITIHEYDIKTSEVPYTSNAKEMEHGRLTDLFNATVAVNPKKADALLDVLVETGGYPFATKILKKWGEAAQQEAGLAQIMQKLQELMARLGLEEKREDVIGKKLDNAKKKQELKFMSAKNVLSTLMPGGDEQKPKSKLRKVV